jgi:putative transposase
MKARFTEEQIIKILKEHEGGKRAADIVREHNITEQTFYRWKSKFGGMEVSEAKRLKQLEDENRKLKELVADLSLDNRILKDVISKNV